MKMKNPVWGFNLQMLTQRLIPTTKLVLGILILLKTKLYVNQNECQFGLGIIFNLSEKVISFLSEIMGMKVALYDDTKHIEMELVCNLWYSTVTCTVLSQCKIGQHDKIVMLCWCRNSIVAIALNKSAHPWTLEYAH